MACDAKTLMVAAAANGYYGLQDRELRMAILYMLCSGGGGGGGGGGLTSTTLDWYNVKNYGAKGDGATDDTATINAAIAAAISAGSSTGSMTVYFPAGTYKITDELAYSSLLAIRFIGDGVGSSIITQVTNNKACFHFTNTNGTNYVVIGGIEFAGNGASVSTNAAILVDTSSGAADSWLIKECFIHDFKYGVRASQFSNSKLLDVSFNNNATAVWLDEHSNSNELIGCDYTADSLSLTSCTGIRYSSGYGLTILGGDFGAPNMDVGLLMDGGSGVTWIGSNCECYITADGFVDHQATGTTLNIIGCGFGNFGGGAHYPILVANTILTITNSSITYAGLHGGQIKQTNGNGTIWSPTSGLKYDRYTGATFAGQFDASDVNGPRSFYLSASDVILAYTNTTRQGLWFHNVEAGLAYPDVRLMAGSFAGNRRFQILTNLDNTGQGGTNPTIPQLDIDCASNRTTIGHSAATDPAGTNVLNVENGDLGIITVGFGVKVKEGSNAKMGTATLNGVTEVTVSTTAVTANSRILMTINTPGGTPGSAYVSSRVGGTSFGIKSTGAADSSTVAWMIVEPA